MSDSDANGNLPLPLLVSIALAACGGVWALFQSIPAAPSVKEHESLERRVENLEGRVDSLWQRPTRTSIEIDGQKFEGTAYGAHRDKKERAPDMEYFESDELKAVRGPGGKWRIIWQSKE